MWKNAFTKYAHRFYYLSPHFVLKIFSKENIRNLTSWRERWHRFYTQLVAELTSLSTYSASTLARRCEFISYKANQTGCKLLTWVVLNVLLIGCGLKWHGKKIFFEGIQLRSKVILLTSLSERPLLKLRLKKVAKNRPKSLKLGDFLVD